MTRPDTRGADMGNPHDAALDAALRRLTAEQVASAPDRPPFDDVRFRATTNSSLADDQRSNTGRWVLAAAASVIVLVAGLAIVTRNNGDPTSVASIDSVDVETTAVDPGTGTTGTGTTGTGTTGTDTMAIDTIAADAGRPLAEVTELERGLWLLPTVMLDGYDFQYALDDQGAWTSTFGEGPERDRQILVGIWRDFDEYPRGSEPMTFGEQTWQVTREEGWWSAQLQVGSGFVLVEGSDFDDATAGAVIESLRMVTPEEMTPPPLALEADQALVASFVGDSGTITMSADASNGWYSLSLQGPGGAGSTGAAVPFESAEVISVPFGGGYSFDDLSSTVVNAEVSGIVSADVVRVEVEFLDGSVATVEPTDLSGDFEVKFFVALTEVQLNGISPDLIGSVIVESRAFDASGTLIGTHRPDVVVFDEPFPDSRTPETTTP